MRAAVSVAVYAAEQIYGAAEGKQKLLYVKGQLAKKGYIVDIDEIEAAVRELKLQQWGVGEQLYFPAGEADSPGLTE